MGISIKRVFPSQQNAAKSHHLFLHGVEIVQLCIKAASATFSWLVSVKVAPSYLISPMTLKLQLLPSQKQKFRTQISTLSIEMQCTGMYETPTGNRWLKNVIESMWCDGCISVKCVAA